VHGNARSECSWSGHAAVGATAVTWRQVESYNVGITAEIGLARGKDGILHVLWLKGGAWSKPAKAAGLVSDGAVQAVTDTAATDKSGRPWVAYTLTDTLAVNPIGKPSQTIPPTACCVYFPGLASDGSTGLTWVTYYSNIKPHWHLRAAADRGGQGQRRGDPAA
jgi:hypothetical protein